MAPRIPITHGLHVGTYEGPAPGSQDVAEQVLALCTWFVRARRESQEEPPNASHGGEAVGD
eukprot:9304853-Alexandrium_andersonii.AAC.1